MESYAAVAGDHAHQALNRNLLEACLVKHRPHSADLFADALDLALAIEASLPQGVLADRHAPTPQLAVDHEHPGRPDNHMVDIAAVGS